MSDLIKRQDVIDAIANVDMQMYEGNAAVGRRLYLKQEEILSIIENFPSADPKRKWIPVSKRLPWNDTNVLVTVLDDSGDTPWSYTSIGWLTPKGEYWVVDNEMCYGVVAWMPLPEPYRAEMRGE